VILAVGYQREVIQSHFGEDVLGLQIVYSPELIPLGTGGALHNAANLVQSSTVLVLNGDSYTDADLNRFQHQHDESTAEMSLLVVPPDGRDDCGTVPVDEYGRVLAFQEKQAHAGPKYVNAGIYLMSRDLLLDVRPGIEVSLERELIPGWLEQGRRIRATVDPAACYDIGTPERYLRAQTALAEVEVESRQTALGAKS
jgi:mannose-1-phosphate guanylyltransferase